MYLTQRTNRICRPFFPSIYDSEACSQSAVSDYYWYSAFSPCHSLTLHPFVEQAVQPGPPEHHLLSRPPFLRFTCWSHSFDLFPLIFVVDLPPDADNPPLNWLTGLDVEFFLRHFFGAFLPRYDSGFESVSLLEYAPEFGYRDADGGLSRKHIMK